MADRDRSQPHNLHLQPHQPPRHEGGMKQLLPRTGPSTSQIIAVVTLLPITLTLLGLAGITLAGTLLGLALATPVLVICSPVLVPAAILMAGAVTAIISSGAFGVTGLSSLSYVFNSFRRVQGPVDYAMRSVQEGTMQVGEKARQMGEHVGEKTKQTGEMIKSKAQPEGKEGAGVRT